ncbi:MAG TPA: 23S rRNA (adenine(2503)-C(2))-methyltransferase RlmN [Thermoanaerobaculia bacterium]|nr:23S rRNA (adenine(2503)-C(2))-methyltransferase RlmN [Thermoanaerobaculia bacterium]
MTKTNLYDLPPSVLEHTLGEIVSPPFRIRQIEDWLHLRGVDSFEAMTNVPKEVRSVLAERFTLAMPEVVDRTAPAADASQKYLLKLSDGNRIESVYMPMRDRTSICLSSQAGCAVGCTFCVTGFFGAGRNLTPSEMLGQFFIVQREHRIPMEMMNVVFMGMGEPLLNLENLISTLEILYRNIAPKRITVSTSGIVPGLEELARLERRPNLAISINAPDQKRREEIMPITKKYPLDELMAALRRFPLEKGREFTIEYVLLAGYNDSSEDARALAKLIRGLHAKVNAIPFNEDANLPPWMKRPTDQSIDRFVDALVRAGARVTVRRSKGREIAAACGQLRGKTAAKSRATRLREREAAHGRVDRTGRVETAGVERHRIDRERR